MKKITIIINSLEAGGAERYVVDSVNEMLGRGIDVNLITLKTERRYSFASELILPEDHWKVIHFKNIYDIPSLFHLTKLLRAQKSDAVITNLWFANTVGRVAAYFAWVPKIFSVEHSIHDSKSWKQKTIDYCLQGFSTKIIAVSHAVEKSLIAGGIHKGKIQTIYVSLNMERFKQFSSVDIRMDHGVSKDEFIFLSVGRLNGPKNIATLIKAFSMLDYGTLWIAGTGPADFEKGLQDLAEKYGNGRVRFLGFVRDVSSLMANCNCFVFPSLWESLGLVAVEALLSGLPVITTANTAMSEFVEDGYNGLLINNPKDSQELALKMREMMDNDELRKRLAANARNLKIDFSIEHNIDRILNL